MDHPVVGTWKCAKKFLKAKSLRNLLKGVVKTLRSTALRFIAPLIKLDDILHSDLIKTAATSFFIDEQKSRSFVNDELNCLKIPFSKAES